MGSPHHPASMPALTSGWARVFPWPLAAAGCLLLCWFSRLPARAGQAPEPRPSYALIQRGDVPVSNYSALGREAIRRQPSGALIGRSDHFIAFAENLRDLSVLLEEAEFSHQYIGAKLGLSASTSTPALLMPVTDDKIWRRWTRTYGLRPDGLAMQIGRELYFKDDPAQKKRPDRIAHEVVHLRLSEAFGEDMPLWLEEGLAGYYGWLCAVAYSGRRDVVLVRNQPGLEEKLLYGLEDLLNMRRYPRGGEQARAFYRQSEELVGVLADRLGAPGMPRFVHAMCGGETSRIRFREAAGLDEQSEIDVIEAMRRRSMTVRKP